NTSVKLPVDAVGNYYIVVRTDSYFNQVVESSDLNNDRASTSPIAVGLRTLPDLDVTSIDAPTDANSGQATQITWTITNQGAALTASDIWYDTVYLSLDATLDNTDRALGTYQFGGPFANGASYSPTRFVTLPPGISGPYYLIVSTDSSNR